MHTVDFRDALIRAAKTAVAAFISVVPAEAVVAGDVETIRAGAIIAGAAAVTFVWNVLLDWTR